MRVDVAGHVDLFARFGLNLRSAGGHPLKARKIHVRVGLIAPAEQLNRQPREIGSHQRTHRRRTPEVLALNRAKSGGHQHCVKENQRGMVKQPGCAARIQHADTAEHHQRRQRHRARRRNHRARGRLLPRRAAAVRPSRKQRQRTQRHQRQAEHEQRQHAVRGIHRLMDILMPKHLKYAADQHRPELVDHRQIFRHIGLFKALKPRNPNQAEERHALRARQVDKRRQHGGHAQQQADRAGNRRMPLLPAENQLDDRAGQNRRRGDKEIHILRVSRQRQRDHARIERRRFGYAARNQAQRNRQQIQRRARAAGHPRLQHENRAERDNRQHPARRAFAGKRLAKPVGRWHRRAGEQRERQPHRQLAQAEQTDERRGQHGQQRSVRLARPL